MAGQNLPVHETLFQPKVHRFGPANLSNDASPSSVSSSNIYIYISFRKCLYTEFEVGGEGMGEGYSIGGLKRGNKNDFRIGAGYPVSKAIRYRAINASARELNFS